MKKALAILLLFGVAAFSQEEYWRWSAHRSITLNTSATGVKIATNVRGFPLLVRIPAGDSIFRQTLPGGADLRFSKPDNATPLPFEIEQWDSTRSAVIWVRVDTVHANNATQAIHMHWKRPGVSSQSSGPAVFKGADGFLAVWHLNDAVNQTDATGSGNTATPSTPEPVTATATSSLIGGAKTFNGSTNWYQVGIDSTALNLNTNVGPYSLSGWVNPASCDSRIALISKYANSNTVAGRQYALHTGATTTAWRFTNDAPALTGNGDAEFIAEAPNTCVAGSWSHIAATYRSGSPTLDSAVNAKIYVNGILASVGSTASITGTSFGSASKTYIGRIASNERYFNGSMDEVRVHSAARDSNWIWLDYSSQRPGSTLLSPNDITVSLRRNSIDKVSRPVLSFQSNGNTHTFSVSGYSVQNKVVLALSDLSGRVILTRELTNGILSWNGKLENGQAISSGVYFARISFTEASGARSVLRQRISINP